MVWVSRPFFCATLFVSTAKMVEKRMCTSFRGCDGHSRKIGFLTFVVCMWEERAVLRMVGLFR